jgi:hypothetical protein
MGPMGIGGPANDAPDERVVAAVEDQGGSHDLM